MIKLLLDANLSPETRRYLIKIFAFDIIDLITENQAQLPDEDVVKLAIREKRIVVTFDLDFGEIYHFREKGNLGVIILRLEDKTVESVNKMLHQFFREEAEHINLYKSLVVIEEKGIRIYPSVL